MVCESVNVSESVTTPTASSVTGLVRPRAHLIQSGILAAIRMGATADVTASQRNGCWAILRKGSIAHNGLLIAVAISTEKITTQHTTFISFCFAFSSSLVTLDVVCRVILNRAATAGKAIANVAIIKMLIHQRVTLFSAEKVEKTKLAR